MMWAVALQVVSRYMSLLSYSEGVPLQGSPWWSRTLALCSCVLCVLAVSYTCSKVVFPDGYSTVQLVLCTLGHASVASVHVLSLRARALLNSLCLPLRAYVLICGICIVPLVAGCCFCAVRFLS